MAPVTWVLSDVCLLVWTCQCERGASFMQCPMQRKAGCPTLKLALQTAAGRQENIQPAGFREKRTAAERECSRIHEEIRWGVSSLSKNETQKNRRGKKSHDSETVDGGRGKKKNKLYCAKQIQSSLVCVLIIIWVLLQKWVESWAGGRVLSGLGAMGGGQQSEKDGPE